MKKRFTFLFFLLVVCSFTASAQWTMLETDNAGDGGDPSLLDGVAFEYMHDLATDSLWFRITTSGISDMQSMDVGVNIMVWFPNPAADETLFQFWSPGNSISWHRLLTTWVTGSAPSNYSGTIGISQGADVTNANYDELVDDLTINVNPTENTIIIGMNRADLIPNDQLGQAVEISSAVGSSMAWNDDILTSTTAPIISLMEPMTTSIDELTGSDAFYVFPNPATNEINIQSNAGLPISTLEFYDLSGKLVRSMQTNSNLSIDISALPVGSFILKAYAEGVFSGVTKVMRIP